jgi:hypothetical protein
MHLKIPLFSRGLKLPSSKLGFRVSALHFSVKQIPPMAFWHRAHSNKCFLQLLIPGLTPVSLLERELGLGMVTQLVDTGKRPSLHLKSNVLLYNPYFLPVYCDWTSLCTTFRRHDDRDLTNDDSWRTSSWECHVRFRHNSAVRRWGIPRISMRL